MTGALVPDILIRAATVEDADAIADLHAATWRDSFRGMIPDAVLDGALPEARRSTWRAVLAHDAPGRLVLVAQTADKRIVGFSSAGRARAFASFPAEIYTLYVAQALRGQHLGLRLMSSVATRLALFGHGGLMLWTLAANTPARGFYESLGASPAGTRLERVGGAALDEVGYAWPRIRDLIEACGEKLAVRSF